MKQSQMSLHIVCITDKNVNMLLTQIKQQRSWKITMYPRKHMQAMCFLMLNELSYQIGIQHEYTCFISKNHRITVVFARTMNINI